MGRTFVQEVHMRRMRDNQERTIRESRIARGLTNATRDLPEETCKKRLREDQRLAYKQRHRAPKRMRCALGGRRRHSEGGRPGDSPRAVASSACTSAWRGC